MRILLTGSNGFLGGKLKKYFSERTYFLDIYSRQSSYYEILESNQEFDVIINAASATPKNCKKDFIIQSNIITTSRLCNIALKCNTKYFINISSVSVYGKPSTNYLNEDSPLNALDNYGYSKLLSEEIINSNLNKITKIYHFRAPGIVGRGSFEASSNFISSLIYKMKKNAPIEIHSPKSKFNNITSDYSIFKCIEHVLNNEIESGPFLMASNEYLLLERVVSFLMKRTKSVSTVNWIEEPTNHQPFIFDNSKCNKFNFPIRNTIEELEYFVRELGFYE